MKFLSIQFSNHMIYGHSVQFNPTTIPGETSGEKGRL